MSSTRTRRKQSSAKKERPSSAPSKKLSNSHSKKRAHSHPFASTLPKLKSSELFRATQNFTDAAAFEENLIDEHFEKLNISHKWRSDNDDLLQQTVNLQPISWEIDIKPFAQKKRTKGKKKVKKNKK